MVVSDLEIYCKLTIESGASHAKQINPSSVVTASWVRWKCQFGCPGYGNHYTCPPFSPTPDQTRSLLDSYNRAILFHIEALNESMDRIVYRKLRDTLIKLEGEMFKDGYYKAFILLAGPCNLCKECAKLKNEPCYYAMKARPSMEAAGIDVYQTARNNGFPITPLRERTDTQNSYYLMLVD